MDDVYLFQAIEYRNGLYEGLTKQSRPQGMGLFFDDDSALYSSIWNAGVPNGRTAVFISQAKYFYGEWQMGKPHGFNVLRSGDTVLLGSYMNGNLVGRFMIIFEKQNFVTIVSGLNQIKQSIEKKYFQSEEELKNITNRCFESVVRVDDYFQFVFFLKNSFCLQNGHIKLQFQEGDLRFGYDRGLGVIFDDDNFIRKVGYISENRRICGLGASYGITNEEGNFQTGNVLRYNTGNKPTDKLRALFKGEHMKSIFYRNDFVPLRTSSIITVLDETLRKLINKIVELPSTSRIEGGHQTARQLNDSLEYQPRKKNIDDVERIRKMKFQLDQSVGKVGSEISSPFIKYQNGRNQMKQLYFTPLVNHECMQPQGIRFANPESNLPYVNNRNLFIQENKFVDYRKRYDTLLCSPNSSRTEQPYLDRHKIIKKNQKAQPSYVKRNKQKDKLLDEENERLQRIERQARLEKQQTRMKQEQLARQRNKQKQLSEQIERQIEKEREKQAELNRQRQITFSIQKEVEQLPKIINKLESSGKKQKLSETPRSQQKTPRSNKASAMKADAPAQTSFSIDRQSLASDVNYKFSADKSTAIKPPAQQIHYNPFLRTFVSSKYPPLVTSQQPFKNIEVVPSLNQLNLRPTINSQEMDDSLEKIKGFKLTQFKPPRYLIQGNSSPSDRQYQRTDPAHVATPKKKSNMSPSAFSPQNKLKQQLQQELARQKSKSYLQIYKTSATHVERQNPPLNKSKSPLMRNPSINRGKKVIQSPYTPSKNKQRQHINKKIIQIEHERTSPQGKKTTSFERIVKKYHYITQKA